MASYALAFGAPVVTEEEERKEREDLTDDERQNLHNELYGGEEEQLVEETDVMLANGVALLRTALEQIPEQEKEAYLEALERAPLLVETESDLAAFLRWENYDAWAAARSVVTYWDTRRKVFGNERAFLPMTLSGAMALDMESMEQALLMKLPDDEHGRRVLHYDRMRCGSSAAPRDSIVRCIFYMMQVLCSSEGAQRRGVVLVVNYRVSSVGGVTWHGVETADASMRAS
jgi:hypothetical protein